MVPQTAVLIATTTVSVGLVGWLCTSGKSWAAWVGSGLCIMNVCAASFGLRGEPLVYRDLYLAHNLYLSFTVHLFITLSYLSQLLLFVFAIRQKRPNERRR